MSSTKMRSESAGATLTVLPSSPSADEPEGLVRNVLPQPLDDLDLDLRAVQPDDREVAVEPERNRPVGSDDPLARDRPTGQRLQDFHLQDVTHMSRIGLAGAEGSGGGLGAEFVDLTHQSFGLRSVFMHRIGELAQLAASHGEPLAERIRQLQGLLFRLQRRCTRHVGLVRANQLHQGADFFSEHIDLKLHSPRHGREARRALLPRPRLGFESSQPTPRRSVRPRQQGWSE